MDISDIAAVCSLVVALALAAWAAWQVLTERVRCSEREIVKRHGWRKESMALAALERNLPGFSIAEFQRRFEMGDVEDTIEVWCARLS